MTTNTVRTLADLAVLLADSLRPEFDDIETLTLLVESAVAHTRAAATGILLRDDDGTLHLVASSSEAAADVETTQLAAADGPCIESFNSGEQTPVTRLQDHTDRWPQFTAAALANGYVGAHAFPLTLRNHRIGAMNVFLTDNQPLSDRDVGLLHAFTGLVTISILQRQTTTGHETTTEHLHHALADRTIIEQAKGILMGRLRIPAEDAFALLRTRARTSRTKVADIAHTVVQQHLNT